MSRILSRCRKCCKLFIYTSKYFLIYHHKNSQNFLQGACVYLLFCRRICCYRVPVSFSRCRCSRTFRYRSLPQHTSCPADRSCCSGEGNLPPYLQNTPIMVIVYSHCRARTQIPTQIWAPSPMAALYFTIAVPIAQTQTQILIQIPNRY